MRKLLASLLVLVLLLVIVVVAAPFVLPSSWVKQQVQSFASEALGRELTIDGELSYSFWPPLSLKAQRISLANRPGETEPMMASIDEIDIKVDALAYRDGRLDLVQLSLIRPVANLSIDESGVPNWQFSAPGQQNAGEDRAGGENDASEGFDGPRIVVGEVLVEDGIVTFEDRRSGLQRKFEDLRLSIAGSPDGSSLDIDGSVAQGGEQADLSGQVADANELAIGGRSAVEMSLNVPGGSVTLKGDLEAATNGFDVALHLDLDDPRRLASWAGQPLDLPEEVLRAVALEANFVGDNDAVDIAPLILRVDDISIEGDLALALSERAKISGRLKLGALDLNAYLPVGEQDKEPAETSEARGETASDDGWPDAPLDLPLPLPVDIDLSLGFESLTAKRITLGAGEVELLADMLDTRVEVKEPALYGGSMTATAVAVAEEPTKVTLAAAADGVALQPILMALAEFDRLEGTGKLEASLVAEGNSIKAFVDALDGKGAVLFRDGAILGINIGATVRSVMTLGVDQKASEVRRTDFAELGGTFVIEQGLLRNDDMALRAPVLRVNGAGQIDLSEQTLDYALTPRLASTLEGQDASAEPVFKAGIPIVFKGPWAEPDFQLEIGGALTGDLADPAALADTISGIAGNGDQLEELKEQFSRDSVEGGVGGLVEGLLGGGAGPELSKSGDSATGGAGAEIDAEGNTEDAPKKLIDALGGFIKQD